MKIKSLKVKDYRNYPYLHVEFGDGVNIFYGDNAQGKTNILEAAYVSSTTKSHRGSKDRDMIRFGCEEAHIETIVEKDGIDFRIDIHLKKNGAKGIAVNRMPIKKAGELFGVVHFVFFSPEDMNIIKRGPSERRRFVDMELSQLDKVYFSDLSRYHRTLGQRNRLLKDLYDHPELEDTLEIWDEQLVRYGVPLINRRNKFIYELSKKVSSMHEKLTGGKESLTLSYEPNTEAEEFKRSLFKNREKDMRLKNTNVGPHRDDICFLIKDVDIRRFGSQGQQRTAALSLKLSEIDLVKEKIHDAPVLLLDDVLSELDEKRQNYLLDGIHDIQTLITCTGLEEFVQHRFEMNQVFHVDHGTVIREN